MSYTILTVVIVLTLFATRSVHSFNHHWGYVPSGLIGTTLLVLLVLLILRQA